MSGVTKGAKFGEGDKSLLAWMDTQPEGDSALIKIALYALMEQRSRGGNTPDAPVIPPVIDMDLLKEIIDYAVDRGAEKIGARVADKIGERLEGMTFPIPLNEEKKKKKEPEKPKIDSDKLFAEAMAGFDTWGN